MTSFIIRLEVAPDPQFFPHLNYRWSLWTAQGTFLARSKEYASKSAIQQVVRRIRSALDSSTSCRIIRGYQNITSPLQRYK